MDEKITSVQVNMYCLGTGDCFLYLFKSSDKIVFRMMVDCGSCRGNSEDFRPIIDRLKKDIGTKLNLLVITHEHNDHVNGFDKIPDLFDGITIEKAWFSWCENENDSANRVDELLRKRTKTRLSLSESYLKLKDKNSMFANGIKSLMDENLPMDSNGEVKKVTENDRYSLPGFLRIRDFLKERKVETEYLLPGQIITIENFEGLKFYILGPPFKREQINKKEKEGKDVFEKKVYNLESDLVDDAFNIAMRGNVNPPFATKFIVNGNETTLIDQEKQSSQKNPFGNIYNNQDQWRRIDEEYLYSASSLALRLNSHINNTSLAMAIEIQNNKKEVLLLPGDAEFGSWHSWHSIEDWETETTREQVNVSDLLRRTIFYKVSHHLSFNGTPTELGINLMTSNSLISMATLDLKRISENWKSTMPNVHLLKELSKNGRKLVIMNTKEIVNPFDPNQEFMEHSKVLKKGEQIIRKSIELKLSN